jgi:hypothetical protein
MLLAHRKAHLPVPPLRTQLQAAAVADLVVAVAVDMKAVVVVDIKAAVAVLAYCTNP